MSKRAHLVSRLHGPSRSATYATRLSVLLTAAIRGAVAAPARRRRGVADYAPERVLKHWRVFCSGQVLKVSPQSTVPSRCQSQHESFGQHLLIFGVVQRTGWFRGQSL